MNSILLSGLNSTPLSGQDALLNPKAAGARSSFAQLLQQQSDPLDQDLAQWLQSLDLDDPAALFAQLKAAGLDPKALLNELKVANIDSATLTQAFQGQPGTARLQRLEQLLAQHDQDSKTAVLAAQTESSPEDALAFIQSTLFIAQESSSLRQAPNNRLPDLNHNAQTVLSRFSAQPETRLQATPFTVDHLQGQLTSTNAALGAQGSAEGRFALNANFQAIAPTETTIHFAPLNVAASTTQAALGASPNYSAQIPTPVHHAQWSADLGRVMVTLTQQAQQLGPQNAEIRLDPPELGPLRIVLSVVDNVANATIYAAHAHTRLTVEQALPQLQQQLAQSGLSLGDANVSDQGFAGQADSNQAQQQANDSATFSLNGTDPSAEKGSLAESTAGTKPVIADAIIDTFA